MPKGAFGVGLVVLVATLGRTKGNYFHTYNTVRGERERDTYDEASEYPHLPTANVKLSLIPVDPNGVDPAVANPTQWQSQQYYAVSKNKCLSKYNEVVGYTPRNTRQEMPEGDFSKCLKLSVNHEYMERFKPRGDAWEYYWTWEDQSGAKSGSLYSIPTSRTSVTIAVHVRVTGEVREGQHMHARMCTGQTVVECVSDFDHSLVLLTHETAQSQDPRTQLADWIHELSKWEQEQAQAQPSENWRH